METFWFVNDDQKFLIGDNISIAGLSAGCELAQIMILEKNIIKQYPKVHNWLQHFLSTPVIKEVHDKVIPNLTRIFKENGQFKL